MLETLRLEIARISLYLELEELYSDQIGYAGARQYPKANKFIELKARVTNLARKFFFFSFASGMSAQVFLAYAIIFALDLEVSPSEYLVYEGVFTDLPVGRLGSGEIREISVSLCFLSCGRFEISGQVRGVGPDVEGRIARTLMTAVVTEAQ